MFFCSSGGSEPLNMSKTNILRGIITEKLSTAAREILAVVERTVTDYEEEASGFRQEIDRQRRQLELLQPQVKPTKRALVPDQYSHEVEVVSEEQEQEEEQQEQQTGVEETQSQCPSWNDCDDDDDDKPSTTVSKLNQDESEEPDSEVPWSSSGSESLHESKTTKLRGIITEKLSTAAQEILEVVERTVLEEEASGFRQEIDRQRRQLELLQPQVKLHREDLRSHEVKIGEEEEQQLHQNTGVEEAESQVLPLNDGDEDEDVENVNVPKRKIFRPNQEDLKDPDYEIPSRSVSSRLHSDRRRPGRPQTSDVQDHVALRIRLLKDPQTSVLTNAVFRKSPVQDLMCPRGLQEPDFLDLLRSTFPQLAHGEPFEVFLTDRSRRLQPLKVRALTPEEIYTTIRSSRSSALYVRLKKKEEEEEEEGRGSSGVADLRSAEPGVENKEEPGLHKSSVQTPTRTRRDLLSRGSTSQQDLQTSKEEPENHVDVGNREELDGDDSWNPDPDLKTVKRTSRKKVQRGEKKTEETKMSCRVCGIWYRKLGSLIKHTWTHLDEQQDVCGVCGEKLPSVEELKEHLRNHQKVHSCSHCEKTFVSVSSLNSHMTKHTGNSVFICNFCGKTFTNMSALSYHRWVHVEDKPHKCDVCLRSFGLLSHLRVHRKSHAGGDKYQCDVCQRSFNLRRSLTQHRLTHSAEKLYSCGVCEKRFKLEGTWKSHMKTHTVRDRTFLCHICCKTFLSKSTLMVHLKIHSSERPFVCSACSKSFTAKSELKKHSRIHTGETPYECSECGRLFKQKANLDSHLKIHLGIKQFVCGVCGKACSRREHLKVHMRTHNGERPYKCPQCEKTFTQSHCLKTHLKSHQTEENQVPDPPESGASAACEAANDLKLDV